MSYALKIKKTDFSDVAVDQVTYIVPIPCTGISLSTDTLTFERAEDTSQLSATLTPIDTTDHVTWSSSDENIATVSSSGLVTIHGLGSATITATCGTQTATASISVSTLKAQYDFAKVSDRYPDPTGDSSTEIRSLKLDTTSGQYAVGQPYHAQNTGLHFYNSSAIECIKVPYGATMVYFAVKSGESDFTVAYLQFGTTDGVVLNTIPCTKYAKHNTNVSAVGGKAVEYGQCIALRLLAAQEAKMGDYAYFT